MTPDTTAAQLTCLSIVIPVLNEEACNLTVEIPLKAIVRGYSWTVIPVTWRNRRHLAEILGSRLAKW